MDRCPAELHLRIFSFACTDGGRTGCALSLVSRHIRSTSFPVRFYTIELSGVPRMRLFLNTLKTMPYPPSVSHLLLSADAHRLEGKECAEEHPSGVVMDILLAVASTLVSLTGSIPYNVHRHRCASTIPASRAPHFPLLRDLSWHIDTSQCIIWGDTATNSPQLPSLRRLHLWGTPIPRDQISYVTIFTKAAPQMTHLRLSSVSQFGELPHLLAAALEPGEAQPLTHEAALRIELPEGLEQLIVQSSLFETSSPGRNGWCGTGSIVHTTMERNLFYIAWKYDKPDAHCTCMQLHHRSRQGGLVRFHRRKGWVLEESAAQILRVIRRTGSAMNRPETRGIYPQNEYKYGGQSGLAKTRDCFLRELLRCYDTILCLHSLCEVGEHPHDRTAILSRDQISIKRVVSTCGERRAYIDPSPQPARTLPSFENRAFFVARNYCKAEY